MATSAVLLPCKYNPKSTCFSNQIAAFLAKELRIPLLHEDNWQEQAKPLKTLYLVNFPFAFCGMEDGVAKLVREAKEVVWVQNDYTIVPPKTNHKGPQSKIRRAFGDRKDPLIYWTNRPDMAGERGAYINWNQLAYQPLKARDYPKDRNGRIVYYGSYRKGRESSFDRYFRDPRGLLTVACSKRTWKKFAQYGAHMVESLQPMIEGLSQYSGSLYLEDDDTHENYHSPANRFYEALAARTALLIDHRCTGTFKTAGIPFREFIVWQEKDLKLTAKQMKEVAEHQQGLLVQDFHGQLREAVFEAVTRPHDGL